MSDRYEWILAQTNDWLRFAEAKNAALVVFNSAVLVATAQLVGEYPPAGLISRLYVGSLWVLMGVGLIVALFSFLPKTTIPLLSAGELPREQDNLIFFGSAKKYTAPEYITAVNKRYGISTTEDDQWRRDIAEQVVTNARIAVWKYSCFKVALAATIWGVLTPIAGPLVFGLLYAWSKTHRI